MSESARVLTVRIGEGGDRAVLLHAADAARLSGFVDGSDVWIKPYGGHLRVRERGFVDIQQAITGPGVLLAPRELLDNLSLSRGAMVEVSSAKPRRPPIYVLYRYEKREEIRQDGNDDIPFGVPPDLLHDLPRRRHAGRERLIVLFDNSGSMSGRAIDDAKQALQTLIESKVDRPDPLTGQVDDVGLIRFGSTVDIIFPPTTDFAARLPDVLALTASGGTPMEEALELLPSQFNDAPNPWRGSNKRCIIITDGGASVSDGCIATLVQERIEIVAIEIGDTAAPVLQALATATGGVVVSADSLWKLDVILARLA